MPDIFSPLEKRLNIARMRLGAFVALALASVGFAEQSTVPPSNGHEPAIIVRIGSIPVDGIERPLDSVREVAFSPDARFVAIRGEPSDPSQPRTIDLVEIEGKRTAIRLEAGGSPLAGMCFSPDGKLLTASPSGDAGETRTWSLPRTKSIASFAGSRGRMIYRPDSLTLATRSPFGTQESVRWVRGSTGEEVRRFSVPGVYFAEFSPDATLLAATSRFNDSTVRLIDVGTGREWKKLGEGKRQPSSLRFAPNGRTVAALFPQEGVAVWEVATGANVTLLHTSSPEVSLAFSPDDRTLAVGCGDGSVRLLDITTSQELVWRLHEKAVSSVAFSSNARRLASGSLDRTVAIVDMPSHFALPSETIVLTDDERLRLWDDLGAASAASAYRAMGRVRDSAATSWPWLLERVRRQVQPPERARIEVLLRDLDDADSLVRYRATEELKKLRELARPMLTALARQSSSAEVRWRARRILQWGDRTPRFLDSDIRRLHRILHLGETISGPEFVALVPAILREVPDADLQRNAAQTLARMSISR